MTTAGRGATRETRLRGILVGLLLLLAGSVVLPSYATAAAPAAASTGTQPEREASISILMTGLSGVNLAAGTFDATFYLGVGCQSPCDVAGWDLVNALSQTSEEVSREDGVTWWRVSGRFVFEPDLRLFPFDSQQLPIVIEHKRLGVDELAYVPDVSGSELAPDVSVPGWSVEPFTFTTSETTFAALSETYSRATFAIPVGRSTLAGLLKYYVPLLIFLMLGAATLVLARSDYQVRTGGTALVGLTIFYLATSGGVASVGYLTLWDVSVLIGYVALGLVLLCGVIGSYRFHEGEYEGEDGPAKSKRLRFGFLRAVLALVVLGGVGVALVGTLT